jgi:hypothetical protein
MSMLISARAAAHLKNLISGTTLQAPVVTIGKSELPSGEESAWYVGLMERESLAGLKLETVGDLFVFVDTLWQSELDGSMLDIQSGRLLIVPGGSESVES